MSKKEQTILEEAAEDFVWEVMENDEDGISELCRKLRPSSKISEFYDALGEFFKAGSNWQKEQMMKDAVEGEVIYHLGGFFRIKSEAIDGAKYKVGSWVKLIIIKED